jgi:hypothetical protein
VLKPLLVLIVSARSDLGMEPTRIIGMVILVLFVGFGMGRLILDGRPAVGERLAAINEHCKRIHSPEEHLNADAVRGMTQEQMVQYAAQLSSDAAAVRRCIGLALEQDPEAAAVWISIHGRPD